MKNYWTKAIGSTSNLNYSSEVSSDYINSKNKYYNFDRNSLLMGTFTFICATTGVGWAACCTVAYTYWLGSLKSIVTNWGGAGSIEDTN